MDRQASKDQWEPAVRRDLKVTLVSQEIWESRVILVRLEVLALLVS